MAVPPLRDRPEDLPLLLKHFLARASAEAGKTSPEVEPEAMACLMRYRWPGNVRELHNVMRTAVLLSGGRKLTLKDLRARSVGTDTSPRLRSRRQSIGVSASTASSASTCGRSSDR